MLSTGAFNALLKTLEEPPEHVLFILATTEVQKLPATILSRCQRFDFRRIPPEDIAARLMTVAENENLQLSNDAALLIARISDGALRDALSILDQCAGYNEPISVNTVGNAAGLLGKDYLFEISDALLNQDSPAVLNIIDRLHSSSCDMERLMSELVNHFRNIMMAKTTRNPEKFIVIGFTFGDKDEWNIVDAEMEKAFGDKLLYVKDYMSSEEALLEMGITPTEADLEDIKIGKIPVSFRMSASDGKHLNDIGYTVLATKVYEKMLELGYITE